MDIVTKQYNECMKEILPLFDIEVIEIPRKVDIDNEIISASRVRDFYKKNDYEALKKLVPNTTLEYLKKLKEKPV